jgi:hypothetical protein
MPWFSRIRIDISFRGPVISLGMVWRGANVGRPIYPAFGYAAADMHGFGKYRNRAGN